MLKIKFTGYLKIGGTLKPTINANIKVIPATININSVAELNGSESFSRIIILRKILDMEIVNALIITNMSHMVPPEGIEPSSYP